MNDRTFAQAIDALNQRALHEITTEALRCWTDIQQGATVASATASIANEHQREAVQHLLFHILLQSVLYEAKSQHGMDDTRYKELRDYVDMLSNFVKKSPYTTLPSYTYIP